MPVVQQKEWRGRMSSRIALDLVLRAGIKVKRLELDIPDLELCRRLMLYRAMGVFLPEDPGCIYLHGNIPDEEKDYVVLHETGHSLSVVGNKAEYIIRMRELAKNNLLSSEEAAKITQSTYEEELIADLFAFDMLRHLNLPIPELLHSRLESLIVFATVTSESAVNSIVEEFKKKICRNE